jgi:hypothetical protein
MRVADAPANPEPPPPPPLPSKLLYMMVAGEGFNDNPLRQNLMNRANVELTGIPNVRGRIKMDYLGEKCMERAGEVCDKVVITQEKKGNIITYQVFFDCIAHHNEQKPVDAERLEVIAKKIARAISLHDQVPHPFGKR